MPEKDEAIRDALRTIRSQTAIVNEFIGPLVDTPMAITEDRLAEIKTALNAYEKAKNAYHDALRDADRTPSHHVDHR